MTGFDETVPPDDDPANDENAVPEHDSKNAAQEDEPTSDESDELAMGGDDYLLSGHYAPTADNGEDYRR